MGYFNVTVKPTIDVAALVAGDIDDAEILFDWSGFDVPKGASRLIGITVLYRGKNGADYAPTDFELFWAKGEKHTGSSGLLTPITLGDDGAAVDTPGWFHLVQGKTYVDASNGTNDGDLLYGNVITVPNVSGGVAAASSIDGFPNTSGLVLQGEPDSGTNVGYDKLYVAAIAKGTHNWGVSTMQVDDVTTNTDSPLIVVQSLSTLTTIGPGDILRDQDNKLLGTVKRIKSSTVIELEANCAEASLSGKVVYNTTPITLLLSFEK